MGRFSALPKNAWDLGTTIRECRSAEPRSKWCVDRSPSILRHNRDRDCDWYALRAASSGVIGQLRTAIGKAHGAEHREMRFQTFFEQVLQSKCRVIDHLRF